MLIIGERINSSRKPIQEAIRAGDADFIRLEAKKQTEAGAHYIDVNAGIFVGEEFEKIKWLMENVQEATDLPLCIDSPDPKVIAAALPLARKTPMINSISLDRVRLETILPLVVENKSKVIALCQSEEAVPQTTEDKVKLAGRIVEKTTAAGLPLDNLYLDPLVYPVATDSKSAQATLDAIDRIMTRFPGCAHHLRSDQRLLRSPGPETGQPDLSGRGHCPGHGFGHPGSDRQKTLQRSPGLPGRQGAGRLLHEFHGRLSRQPPGRLSVGKIVRSISAEFGRETWITAK